MLLPVLLIFAIFFAVGSTQEFGNLGQLIGFSLGSQINALTSCCTFRDLQCSSQQRVTSDPQQNVSSDIAAQLARFSRCVCSHGRSCVLTFPASFLPNYAGASTFDTIFVTAASASQYACSYIGSRELKCQHRANMATGLLGWGELSFTGGGYGPLGALGGAGLLGEDMEELMEQIVDSGIPPSLLRSQPCHFCVPFSCAVRVSRLRTMLQPARGSDRQRYHQCLREHSIPPPLLMASTSPGPLRLPMTPPGANIDPSLSRPLPTNNKANGSISRNKAFPMTTTLKMTTKRITSKPAPVVRVTTPAPESARNLDASTQAEQVTARKTIATTPTPTPQLITRILVGLSVGTSTTPAKQNAVVTKTDGGETSINWGKLSGVVIGLLAVIAGVTGCLVFIYLRRRRRRKQRGEQGPAALNKHVEGLGAGNHFKIQPLPSVSSAKTVSDTGDAKTRLDVQIHRADGDQALDRNCCLPAERYVPLPTLGQSSRLSTKSASSLNGDEDHYASLDETAMVLPCPQASSVVRGATVCSAGHGNSSSQTGSLHETVSIPKKASQKYYNTDEPSSTKSERKKRLSDGSSNTDVKPAAVGNSAFGIPTEDAGKPCNSHYDKPAFSGMNQPHLYTSLQVLSDAAGTPNVHEEPSYIPCATPIKSRNRRVPPGKGFNAVKNQRKGTIINSRESISEEKHKTSTTAETDGQRSSSSLATTEPERDVRGDRRVSALHQNSNLSTTFKSNNVSAVDNDGYLMPVTSPKPQ